LFAVAAPAIVWFYKEPLLKPIVAGMSLSIFFGGLSTQQQALLRRNMNFGRIAATDIWATAASLAVAILFAYRGWGYWALVAKWVVAPAATALAAWILCDWRPGLPARGVAVWPMLRFAFHTYGNFVLFYFGRTIDKMLLGRMTGSDSLGAYDRAYQLSSTLPTQLLSPLNSVAMAAFSRLRAEPAKFRQTYVRLLSVLAFVCMPAAAVLTLTGRDVTLLLLGPRWQRTGSIFSVFGVSIGIFVLYGTHAWLHLSLGRPDRWLRWSIFAFTTTIVLFFIGLPFGPVGVAAAYSASFYLLTPAALWYAGRPIDLRISSVVSGVWKYFVSALAAGLICWSLTTGNGFASHVLQQWHSSARIMMNSLLCVSIYLALVIALYRGGKPISQFLDVVRDMIPPIRSW
jgi:PST family polysaccharide transporter